MTKLYRLLLVVLILTSVVLVYIIARTPRPTADLPPYEVTADSIASYERRADSLEGVVHVLEMDYDAVGLLKKPSARLRLDRLREQVEALRAAIERWRSARTSHGQNKAYRECILLYGKATGTCEVLGTDVPADSTR